ncbi:unnamed protein product [Eruca vesicaria subsp. sativa]|uniref:Uncharacterized protein n=1 Tax=Eruca vesicaria subsp. sativa TaxID=29727 RepID=A0ABC8LMT8_ERUVS|nr:unnamed protein product [Eruca vesicaria subsp. sativa]
MSFISVFAVLSVIEWLGTNEIRLRVSQKLHTSSQVAVGGFVGSVSAFYGTKHGTCFSLKPLSHLYYFNYVFLVASVTIIA